MNDEEESSAFSDMSSDLLTEFFVPIFGRIIPGGILVFLYFDYKTLTSNNFLAVFIFFCVAFLVGCPRPREWRILRVLVQAAGILAEDNIQIPHPRINNSFCFVSLSGRPRRQNCCNLRGAGIPLCLVIPWSCPRDRDFRNLL